MTPDHEMAADLLEVVWRGVPADYKSRYRMSIWQQFEDQVRSAAYTSSLPKFINSICSKLQANVGKNKEDRIRANEILNAGKDIELLKLIRNETTVVVLMVRVRNQDRQKEWEERMAMENDPLALIPQGET